MEDERFKSEMMRLMGTVINKLDVLKTDVKELKSVQKEHSQILNEHSQILKKLDAKTDSIAETVLNHEIHLTKVEKVVEELRGGVQ